MLQGRANNLAKRAKQGAVVILEWPTAPRLDPANDPPANQYWPTELARIFGLKPTCAGWHNNFDLLGAQPIAGKVAQGRQRVGIAATSSEERPTAGEGFAEATSLALHQRKLGCR